MQAPITALLLCNDARSLEVIDRTFEEYSISTYSCGSGQTANSSASQRKFDLLMLDFDEPDAEELIEFRATDLWGYPSVVIAIASDPAVMKRTLNKRVHFTLQKPFTPELMGSTLRAGYSLIVNEKRAAFRHTVRMPATASFLEQQMRHPLENVSIHDISQNGLCLQTAIAVPKDATVFVDFQLPDTHTSISTIGKVMWSDATGRAGVHFRFIPPSEQKQLREWLSERCPWDVELTSRT
ncbi:MAG TPA: PilZ domain-containing protein [Candidatus Angelobacter sp.]|jgi:CheY-like chemotaxis protein